MLGQEIDNFLQMMAAEKGAAQNSIAAYEHDLQQFLAHSECLYPEDIKRLHIENFGTLSDVDMDFKAGTNVILHENP